MLQKSLFSLFFFMLFAGVILPSPATAGLFPRNFYTVSIFNSPNVSESKFTIRLAAPIVVSGCASMTASSITTRQVMDTIKIEVFDSRVSLDNRDPRYSLHDCKMSSDNRSFLDIEFDRDELIENGVKHVALKSKFYGEFMTSDIKISKEKIDFTAKTAQSSSLITFWFFPENTVILHAPNAKKGLRVQDMIRDFGVSQGLTPMEDVFDRFELPWNANNYAIFTDSDEHIVSQLSAIDENIAVGGISPTRTIYGTNGATEEPYDLAVYATLPGQN